MPNSKLSTTLTWGYGHVLIFMATAALGAAIAASIDVVTHHAHASQHEVSKWLGASLTVICLALWVARDRMLPLPRRFKLALPIAAALFAAAGLVGLPVWGFAILSVFVVYLRAPDTQTSHI